MVCYVLHAYTFTGNLKKKNTYKMFPIDHFTLKESILYWFPLYLYTLQYLYYMQKAHPSGIFAIQNNLLIKYAARKFSKVYVFYPNA